MNKPKRNRRNYIVKPKVSKKLILSTAASVMAVTIASSLVWNAMKVSVPVEANTLSGVSEALKDHGSGESFVILDIVPGTTDEELPLGTIGYLTSGQSQLEQYLAQTFIAGVGEYKSYDSRLEKADKLAGMGHLVFSDDGEYEYKESLTGGKGWTKVYDGESVIVDKSPNGIAFIEIIPDLHSTVVKGTATPVGDGAGEYVLAKDLKVSPMMVKPASDNKEYSKVDMSSINLNEITGAFVLNEEETIDNESIEECDASDQRTVYVRNVDEIGVITYEYRGTIEEIINNRIKAREEFEAEQERLEQEDLERQRREWEEQQEQKRKENNDVEDSAGNLSNDEKDQTTSTDQTTSSDSTEQPEDTDAEENKDEQYTSQASVIGVSTFGWMRFAGEGDSTGSADDNSADGSDNKAGNGSAYNQSDDFGYNSDDSFDDNSGDGSGDTPDGDSGNNSGDGSDDTLDGDSGNNSGEDSGDTPDDDSGNNSGDGSGDTPDGDSGNNSGDGSGDTPDGDSDDNSDEDSGNNSGEDSDDNSSDGSEDNAGEDSDADSGNNLEDDLMEEFIPEPYEPEEYIEEEFEYIIADFQYVRIASEEELADMELYMPRHYSLVQDVEYEETMPTFAMAAFSEDSPAGGSVENTIVDGDCILVYVGAGKGNQTIAMGGKDAKELLVYNAPIYFRCFDVDLLKEHVFDNSGLNIKINVKSAADVTIEDIKNADLIYLEDVPDRDKVHYISSDYDMSEAAVYNIIDRAVNDLTPVIVDYQVSQGGINNSENTNGMYNDTNYQKLASILLMTDLYSFFQDMDENVANMLINAGSDEYGRKSDDDNHYVNSNIYVVSSINLSSRVDFAKPFDDGEMGGFEEVKSAIDMENRQGKDLPEPSKAMAIQYIINYANGFIGDFRDFSILELQPAYGVSSLNKDKDSRNNRILYWRKPGSSGAGQQIVRSRQLIEITVDTESVAQFVGEQSDINNKYQMIFIGLDGQKLNYDGKDTVYNDSSLNGKVYCGVGDLADGEGRRYEGIDITPQKKNALLDFLQAGYPIVVENNFFVDKSAKDAGVNDINTDYIDESSQMYEFLKIALSSDDYKWCLYTIADIHTHYSDFAAQINVHRPGIEFDWGNAISGLNANEEQMGQIVQTIAADAEGKYRGYIPYKVMDDVGDSYNGSVNTRFYLDMDQDGRFDALEEVTGNSIAIGNGLLVVEFTAPERGSIPWKLEISDSGNRYRRDSLTGYFHITQPAQMPVRIVQVIGDGEGWEDANCNLEAAYEMANDTTTPVLLGYYLRNAEMLTNMKFEIESMTVSQLAAELALNVRYLESVDVLVLGFGPECNLDVPVATSNPLGNSVKDYVNSYISEGRGVLVSSTAPLDVNRMQLDYGTLGLRDIRTYSRLGRDKPSSVNYYKYADLKPGMFDEEWNLLSAVKVNDGAVSHYPYVVDLRVSLDNNISIPDYVLNLYDNGSSGSDVTAWYCLGNSMILSDQQSSYGVSPKDAANNYYLYSKGNVVYIGESRYPYIYSAGTIPDGNVQGTANCKLFVNALMEAYNVGVKNPKVSIVAGLSEDAAETDSICIPYDEEIRSEEIANGAAANEAVLDDTVDVFFKVTEPNLAFEKVVTLEFYYGVAAGTPGAILKDVGGKEETVMPFTSEIRTVEQNQLVPVMVTSGLDLVPGKIYNIKAPVVSLKNDDNSVKADIYIVVQSHFIKSGQDRHPIGSDSVTLNRAQLFLLE